ncbi:hypothetical protein KDX38_01635 [Pseudomonas sp. CDFA 602]|uniref:hypothetical protein n=1 Tax=Pseudomonas californiensis TaxID=2829823 RepID=UPI001E3FB21B|nr:hypothetical protein [Pseudomonas californiensis]MCD5992313.1 hypothetical protein [Pseudomonas californiensis]MCD5997921.1 hypothetical protein [Pseudomonas californiensis]
MIAAHNLIAVNRARTVRRLRDPQAANTVGKLASATDNAEFFHPRIEAPPRLRSKRAS